MYKLLSIGLDQSYTRTGISIAVDGKLVKVSSVSFKGCQNKSDKRNLLRQVLTRILQTNASKAILTVVVCERVRTFSAGSNNATIVPGNKEVVNKSFISTSYIKATGALIATIVDTAYDFGVEVFSADTKAWKARIVGKTKAKQRFAGVKNLKKHDTIQHIINLGFEESISRLNKDGVTVYNDDAADSACIALYAFIPKGQRTLKKEE